MKEISKKHNITTKGLGTGCRFNCWHISVASGLTWWATTTKEQDLDIDEVVSKWGIKFCSSNTSFLDKRRLRHVLVLTFNWHRTKFQEIRILTFCVTSMIDFLFAQFTESTRIIWSSEKHNLEQFCTTLNSSLVSNIYSRLHLQFSWISIDW